MKLKFLLGFLLIPMIGFSQERGAGIRLGEPFSLTYKDFLDDYLSFEVMVGGGSVNGKDYYQRSFENNPPSPDAFYLRHSASRGVALNFRMALHEDITDMFEITEGYLLGYVGAGAQLRTTNVDYSYFKQSNPGSLQKALLDRRTNIDLGPEAFGGAEYYFDETPISIFAEVGIFLELIDRINFKGQGGIGVRYLF
jgi:hypothetical protein